MITKKLLTFALCICVLLSFVSCGGNKENSTQTDTSDTSTQSTDTSLDTTASSTVPSETEESSFEKFDADGDYIPYNYDCMKAMKLTQWDVSSAGLFVSGGTQREETDFTERADKLMKNIAESGYNTVLMQLRPFADSFYPSSFYPISYFVSGNYSNQTLVYDPIKIMVEKAHKYELSVHGWINPMRCMKVSEIEKIESDSDIIKWYRAMGDENSEYRQYMFVETDDGGTTRLYLNPAYEKVRELIVNGIREICENYNVDGIFMDDYFYPSKVLNRKDIDDLAYNAREEFAMSLFKFRCGNVNKLVKEIYSAVKEINGGLIYGISPSGEITRTYKEECADVYTWCSSEGYVDVIYPQFYFGMLHKTSDIPTLVSVWKNTITNENIKFVPVLTLHKAGNKDTWAVSEEGKSEWIDHNDVILQELTYLMTTPVAKIDGIGFFCYQYFYLSEGNKDAVITERENFSFIIPDFEKYNGRSTDEVAAYYSKNGIDLNSKITKWNESRINAGKSASF